LWSADADAFADQIRFCKSHLDIITPKDLPQVVSSQKGRYALITFDDGYRDNYESAFPILKAESVPATFFVASGFLDAPRLAWWDEIAWMIRTSRRRSVALKDWLSAPVHLDEPDRELAVRALLRAYKAAPVDAVSQYLDAIGEATGSGRCPIDADCLWMTWDMLREMRVAGMTIGGHTIGHVLLANASAERQREEILGCCRRLSDEIGEPTRYFSYPVGGRRSFTSVTRDCLREAGIQYAFSDYGGFRRFSDWDDFDIQRVPVEADMTRGLFRSIVRWPQLFA
jgi:peptidoglycan/xylan/chitin deacetylase (PgdA/CDA1 family)